MEIPILYLQSKITPETAVAGVLLFQIRFFAANQDVAQESDVDPRLRVLLLFLLATTI